MSIRTINVPILSSPSSQKYSSDWLNSDCCRYLWEPNGGHGGLYFKNWDRVSAPIGLKRFGWNVIGFNPFDMGVDENSMLVGFNQIGTSKMEFGIVCHDKDGSFDKRPAELLSGEEEVILRENDYRSATFLHHSGLYGVLSEYPNIVCKSKDGILFIKDKTKEFTSSYGAVTEDFYHAAEDLRYAMSALYILYKRYPMAKTVSDLTQIESADMFVRGMMDRVTCLESEIKKWRDEISSLHQVIKDKEKEINEIYDEGAEHVEFLESRGLKVKYESDADE